MKTIGLIGGTSWHSTIDYYRIINETVNARAGNNSSAKILLYSVDFEEIVILTRQLDWPGIAKIISAAAVKLENAGADCLLLCANTMHINAAEISKSINIPLIHVADVTAKAVAEKGISKVLLLGTRYTMQGGFYEQRLQLQGIEMVIPEGKQIDLVNDSIYNEFGKGIFSTATKKLYLDIISQYISNGVEGVILGCTEIPQLIQQGDCDLPVFDTTRLHATAAVDFAGWGSN